MFPVSQDTVQNLLWFACHIFLVCPHHSGMVPHLSLSFKTLMLWRTFKLFPLGRRPTEVTLCAFYQAAHELDVSCHWLWWLGSHDSWYLPAFSTIELSFCPFSLVKPLWEGAWKLCKYYVVHQTFLISIISWFTSASDWMLCPLPHPQRIPVAKPHPQGVGIWRWGLWEEMRSWRQSLHEWDQCL